MERDDRVNIAKFYDQSIAFYERFWHSSTHAVHLGLWDRDTKNLPDALINTNKLVSEAAGIQQGNVILDAGCGIGGTAIWIAKNIPDTKVIGITLSERQAQKAWDLARQEDLDPQVQFAVMGFAKTGFRDSSFDRIVAIESVLYALNKQAFLQEAFRILRSGGTITVADLFQKRPPKNRKETRMLQTFHQGFSVQSLTTRGEFTQLFDATGYTHAEVRDKTTEVLPSFHMNPAIADLIDPLIRIVNKLPLRERVGVRTLTAGMSMGKLLRCGVLEYNVLSAQK